MLNSGCNTTKCVTSQGEGILSEGAVDVKDWYLRDGTLGEGQVVNQDVQTSVLLTEKLLSPAGEEGKQDIIIRHNGHTLQESDFSTVRRNYNPNQTHITDIQT
jgi:hypothetical protein